jgi:hypothetical protein
MPNLISLQQPMAEDSLELTILKGTFNRLATQMNMLWNTLSLEEKQELYAKLKAVEGQIYSYN